MSFVDLTSVIVSDDPLSVESPNSISEAAEASADGDDEDTEGDAEEVTDSVPVGTELVEGVDCHCC